MWLAIQEVSLGSWQLRMVSGEASRSSSPIALFKVPRGTTLPPSTTLTVWTDKAAEREKVAAEPPHVFIMKVENWNLSSTHVVISLLNNKGEARCSYSTRLIFVHFVFTQLLRWAVTLTQLLHHVATILVLDHFDLLQEMATCTLIRRSETGSSGLASVLATPSRLVRSIFGTGHAKRSSSGERTSTTTVRTMRTETSSSTVGASGSHAHGEGDVQVRQHLFLLPQLFFLLVLNLLFLFYYVCTRVQYSLCSFNVFCQGQQCRLMWASLNYPNCV